MTPAFTVRTTPRYERLARRLLQGDSEFRPSQDQAFEILRSDPYNRTRQHNIKKLTGVRHGDGQYRLRLGRWRFRYDITGQEVVLHYCGLRREDTYR
jgi:mRNA-degrading endonuclease RelE of RelBE toxin-antitoxin system